MLVYRRLETPRFPPEPEEQELEFKAQWKALKNFCDRWFKDADLGTFKSGYISYGDGGEFERLFEQHLKSLIIEFLKKTGEGLASKAPQRWWHGSPYRGLQAFQFEHEKIFFGRTQAVDEVLGALRTRWIDEKCPFVMIFGASGSGKSSLMRAGVLPWLVKPGVIDGIGLWRRALLRPADHDGDLLSCLAHALVMPDALPELLLDGTTVEQISSLLRDEPKSITGLIKGRALACRVCPAAERAISSASRWRGWHSPLDQLEEVFTLQDRFTVEDRNRTFRTISALVRSDYVWGRRHVEERFLQPLRGDPGPDRTEEGGAGKYHLLPPDEIALSQMIRYPAEAAGIIFEEIPAKGKLEEVHCPRGAEPARRVAAARIRAGDPLPGGPGRWSDDPCAVRKNRTGQWRGDPEGRTDLLPD